MRLNIIVCESIVREPYRRTPVGARASCPLIERDGANKRRNKFKLDI